MMQSNVLICPMTCDHTKAVAALEKATFSDPWPENIIENELKNPLSLWLVAVESGVVVGYVGSQSVMDEADVMNIAVSPTVRRQGIGERLMLALEQALAEKGVEALLLEVRASNAGAIELYEKLGYAQVGRRPRYYFHPTEDALIMKKKIGENCENIGC